jgi:hypothetical protein
VNVPVSDDAESAITANTCSPAACTSSASDARATRGSIANPPAEPTATDADTRIDRESIVDEGTRVGVAQPATSGVVNTQAGSRNNRNRDAQSPPNASTNPDTSTCTDTVPADAIPSARATRNNTPLTPTPAAASRPNTSTRTRDGAAETTPAVSVCTPATDTGPPATVARAPGRPVPAGAASDTTDDEAAGHRTGLDDHCSIADGAGSRRGTGDTLTDRSRGDSAPPGGAAPARASPATSDPAATTKTVK